MIDKNKKIKAYAMVAWAIIEEGYSLEELEKLNEMEILMLTDDFERFIEEACKNG